jgi:hypothetical protein
MVIQNEELLGLGGHGFQDRSGIAEVNDYDATILEIMGRRLAVLYGQKTDVRKLLPESPGRPEPIGTFGMVQDNVRRTMKGGCGGYVTHRVGRE